MDDLFKKLEEIAQERARIDDRRKELDDHTWRVDKLERELFGISRGDVIDVQGIATLVRNIVDASVVGRL